MDGELPRYSDPEQEPPNETLRRRSTHSNLRSGILPRLSTAKTWSSWHEQSAASDSRSQSRRPKPSKAHGSTSRTREEAVLEADEDIGEDLLVPESMRGRHSVLRPEFFEIPRISSEPSSPKRPGSGRLSFEDSDPLDSATDDPIDNSPFEQVRASVKATDDLTLSISTPRMWFLALLFAILGSSTNLFFSLRYPSVTLTPVVALLLVHPLGLLWDRLLKKLDDPEEKFTHGVRDRRSTPLVEQIVSDEALIRRTTIGKFRLWLAQGYWNEKEHACVYIAANVSFGFAFATDVIVEQSQFYDQKTSWVYQISLVLSTQILGYSLAGLCKNFLVRPSGMVWPGTLMASSMFSTLHGEQGQSSRGSPSRWKFFIFVFFGTFVFYFLPGLIMPALSYFNVITWFAPDNVVVTSFFGVSSGLGMFPVTFDWSQIAYTGSPLLTPFWAAMNVVGGLVVVMWIIAPIMYYTNVLYSAFMPILSAQVFDNRALPYDVDRILTPDYLLDEKAYKNYSPVFLPITYALSYAIQFASITALLTHTVCWHGRDIWMQLRGVVGHDPTKEEAKYHPISNSPASDGTSVDDSPESTDSPRKPTRSGPEHLLDSEDVHNRLMRRYPEVPHLWYLAIGIVTMVVGVFVVEFYPIHLPWWGLILALVICIILFIPIGIVFAVSNLQISIYLVSQIAAGFIFPGRGVANLIFVTYSYITSTQGLKFAADLKLGHYMKIPPRILFHVQLLATIVSSLSQILVLNWMLSNIPKICTPEAINGFTCPIARVHFQGSILYGAINPSRFFGSSALYHPLIWAFPIGAIAPVIVWYIAKRHDQKFGPFDAPTSSIWTKVNFPVIFGSLSWIPPATGLNFSVWAVLCFIFNYVIKNRRNAWWKKYTMTLSAALDAGVAFGVLVIFFGVVYPGFTKGFHWFGTEIYKQGCDWRACPYKTLSEGQTFGPDKW